MDLHQEQNQDPSAFFQKPLESPETVKILRKSGWVRPNAASVPVPNSWASAGVPPSDCISGGRAGVTEQAGPLLPHWLPLGQWPGEPAQGVLPAPGVGCAGLPRKGPVVALPPVIS